MLAIRLLILFIYLFSGANMSTTKENINEYFRLSQEIVIYYQNTAYTYSADKEEFKKIISSMDKICLDSHEMPAYGVSLDPDTREAIKSGLWVEFKFEQTQEHNDMPFDSLLINVNSEDSGFNLIRLHDNSYEGRCFYLSLDGNMSALFETLITLIWPYKRRTALKHKAVLFYRTLRAGWLAPQILNRAI